MNAALEERSPVAAADSEAEIQPPLAALAPPPVVLDEATIARAMTEAEASGQPARDILSRLSGLSGAAYARALAAAFDYRFVAGDELAHLEPDFSMLAPAEATRRHCLIFHEGPRLLAVLADPFDTTIRAWLEIRLAGPIEWALASREELANLTSRRAEALRAIDAVLPAAQRGAQSEQGIDTLSYVSISEDASPVIRLVHSTVFDALRAGASDIHLETTAGGLLVRYRVDGRGRRFGRAGGAAV